MKLFKVVFTFLNLAACSIFGHNAGVPKGSSPQLTGDDESYLMLARRYQYHALMTRIAQLQNITLTQKVSNKDATRLRRKLSMILGNGGLRFQMPKATKAINRRNRFRKYHN